jgi:hypothetical protein
MLVEGEREEGNGGIDRLLTNLIFLDSIPDPFENFDLITQFDPLAFSGLPIRSDPTFRSIWLLMDQQYFSFLLGKLV